MCIILSLQENIYHRYLLLEMNLSIKTTTINTMIIILTKKKTPGLSKSAWCSNLHTFWTVFLCKKMTQQTCSWRVNQVFQPWLWTFSLCYVQGLLHFVRFTAYVLPVQISKVLQHNKTLFQHYVSTCPTGASTKYLLSCIRKISDFCFK